MVDARALLAEAWAAYYAAGPNERSAIDAERLVPVPELRRLLADYDANNWCESCDRALDRRAVDAGYGRCRPCRAAAIRAA